MSTVETNTRGAILNFLRFDYYQRTRNEENGPLEVKIDSKDNTVALQGFVQWQDKPFDRFTINAGWHTLRLFFNGSSALEPRASVKWQPDNRRRWFVQLQPGPWFCRHRHIYLPPYCYGYGQD